MNNCKKCNEPVNGNYCSNCGQPAKLKRIDKHYIVQEIASAFHAERGMLYSIKKMLLSPGKSISQYINEDRSRYVKPITYLIINSLVFTLVSNFFQIDANYFMQQSDMEFPTLNLFINWMIDYHGHSSIISGFFVAFWIRLFFRKSGYNLFEIFILLCFISGTSALFFSVAIILRDLTHLNSIYIPTLIALIYSAWATGQFFDRKKAASYIKAFLSFILGAYTFGLLVTCVGVFIDMVIKPYTN